MPAKIVKMKGKISASEFAVPATDQRGHSARVGFRITPEMKQAITMTMARAPETGWESDSQFWRWAGRLGLAHMDALIKDKRISNLNKRIEFIRQVIVEDGQLVAFRETFELAERSVKSLIEEGREEYARKRLLILEGEIGEIDDEDWRKTWQKKFQQKFGHLIKGARLPGRDRDGEDDE